MWRISPYVPAKKLLASSRPWGCSAVTLFSQHLIQQIFQAFPSLCYIKDIIWTWKVRPAFITDVKDALILLRHQDLAADL